MIKRKFVIMAFLFSCLVAVLLVGIAASVNVYNPLADVDCDGDVDVGDQRKQQLAMFTNGDPINLTVLNATKPIAMGYVISNGFLSRGYNIESCTWNAGTQNYLINITGVKYQQPPIYLTQVTVAGTGAAFGVATSSGSGELVVTLYTTTGTRTQAAFQFVTYAVPGY